MNAKNEKKSEKTTTGKPSKGALRENIEALVIALVLALFIRTFIVQAFKIPSGSMLETLQIGDHILVNKFIYGIKMPFTHKTLIPVSNPKRGDIIVFIYPIDKRDFIKRVIAVEGDTLEIRDKKIFVNGTWTGHKDYERFESEAMVPRGIPERDFQTIWMNQIYGDHRPADRSVKDNFGPITIPKDKLFVMGDNRDNSHDSRFWGFVPLESVKGKAFIIYWSWDSDHFGVRWNRLGDLLK